MVYVTVAPAVVLPIRTTRGAVYAPGDGVNVGGAVGVTIVYAALLMPLGAKPPPAANAFRVTDDVIWTLTDAAPDLAVDDDVGSLPSVVYVMVAPGDEP
jgi:hypothetical protein